MSETTANLALPFILPQQAQKHVTHNDALQRLDAMPDRSPELALMIDSIRASERGLVR